MAIKTKITELDRSKLLRFLGEPNFDYAEIERQKIEYVYRWLVKVAGSEDWQILTLKLLEVEDELPGKRRQRLNRLYSHMKQVTIRDSGRYDITTLRPPHNNSPYDLGWRL